MAYIKQRKYKEALLDCENALYLNDKFAKAHIRAQQCYLVVGEIEKARQAAIKSVELGDSSTASKIPFMEELLKYESYAFKAKEKMEWREALYYLSKILEYATDSIRHLSLKIECLISENPADMTNAIRFTTSLQEQFIDNAEFLFWRGRILLYNGQTDMGKKHLKQALNIDPDNKTYVKYWKGIQTSEKQKEQANELVRTNMLGEALDLYSQCLEFDELNCQFNQAILYNRACALHKLGQIDKAMEDLNNAIRLNKEYAKAYFKKADILLQLEKYQEAIAELTKVKDFAPQTAGLKERIRNAQLELKKSKRKNYYKILGIEKTADEGEIKKAYRKKAIEWHPDKHNTKSEEELKNAESMFKDIGEAYAILSDPQKKQRYDSGEDIEEIEQGSGHGGMNPNDIF